MPFSSIPDVLDDLKAGKMIVLVDDEDRENEGDLVIAAEKVTPEAVNCEVMRADGEMMRRPDLEAFCASHNLKMATIADLISYRLKREQFVKRIESVTLPTTWGVFQLHAYQSAIDPQPHLALCKGGVGDYDAHGAPIEHPGPVLVRVHGECLTGDDFGSGRCDCGPQLSTAM